MAGAALYEMVRERHLLELFIGAIFRIVIGRRLVEQRVNRRRNQLDMADLLRRYRSHQLVEGAEPFLLPHRGRLMKIIVQRRHLAETAAEQFLHGRGGSRIWFGGFRQFNLQAVDAQEHWYNPSEYARPVAAQRPEGSIRSENLAGSCCCTYAILRGLKPV